MINLHVYDDANHLFATAFYIPGADSLRALRRLPGVGPAPEPAPLAVEERMAGALTRAAHYMFQTATTEELRGLGLQRPAAETWVLGPSAGGRGRLDDWFQEESPGKRYRLFLHRMPSRQGSMIIPLLWDLVYAYVEHHGVELKRNTPSPAALRSGVVLMEECLAAYRGDPRQVLATMAGSGHPFWRYPAPPA